MALDCSPWTLTLTSDLRHVGFVRAFVQAVCESGGIDQAITDALVLATHEAANNVIRHAHQGRPNALLQIRCFLRPEEIEIQILDEGPHFSLLEVPHLDPAELRIGGRGVFLMRTLMDELSCQQRDEGGNILRMVKRRGRSS